ncbi:MAG TPA: Yip1 family protein [Polyangia bacterium]|nr:Yip1 family protein [Polyangia bacterium]
MALVERVKNICLKPSAEWPVVEAETPSTRDLMIGYVAPLAAIGPIAGFIGGSVIGRTLPFVGTYRVSFGAGLAAAIVTYAMAFVSIFILSLIINALAPSFGGQKNSTQALKVAVYAFTPAWVAGALQILTPLAILGILLAFYGLYLLYLGLPVLMKSPKEKALGYTVVVVLCAIVLGFLVSLVVGAVIGVSTMTTGHGFGGLPHTSDTSPGNVQFDKDSLAGRLQAMGQAVQESNKKMEAAQKTGDPNVQAKAAMEGLGALLGGGKRVDPIGIDQLKPFVPQTFAGLPKLSSSAEKNGMAGLSVSKAEASYGDHAQKHVTLEISDTGGASGFLALAGWASLQGEREDDNGFERTQKVDGRLMHEQGSKHGGSNEFTLVLGERFIVSAKGSGVELADLKAAVGGLDLGKLEALKTAGVQQ